MKFEGVLPPVSTPYNGGASIDYHQHSKLKAIRRDMFDSDVECGID